MFNRRGEEIENWISPGLMAISWFRARDFLLHFSSAIYRLRSRSETVDCWARKSRERCAKFMTMPFLMNVFMLMQFQTTSSDSASAAERRKYFSLFYFIFHHICVTEASIDVGRFNIRGRSRHWSEEEINSHLCSLHYFHPSPRSRWEWWWKIPANLSAFESLRAFFLLW